MSLNACKLQHPFLCYELMQPNSIWKTHQHRVGSTYTHTHTVQYYNITELNTSKPFLLLSFYHHLVCCYANNANAFLFVCVEEWKATSKHFLSGDIVLLLSHSWYNTAQHSKEAHNTTQHNTYTYNVKSFMWENFSLRSYCVLYTKISTIITMMSCAFSLSKAKILL